MAPEVVGKRVFCSNRGHDAGCGRTMQLYLNTRVRYLHHSALTLGTFLQALLERKRIHHAYLHATGSFCPCNAWRWLQRLRANLSTWRSHFHLPPFYDAQPASTSCHRPHLSPLLDTISNLSAHFGNPLCAHWQQQTQQTFF